MSDLTPLHGLSRHPLGPSTPSTHNQIREQRRWSLRPGAPRRRSFLLFNGLVTGLLMTGLTSCSIVEEYLAAGENNEAGAEEIAAAPAAPVEPPTVPAVEPASSAPINATPPPDTYPDALKKANLAQTLSQSAQSTDDWSLVAGRWEQAINLLEAVPDSSENYGNVAGKLSEYRRQRDSAKVKANQPVPTTSPLGRVVVVSDGEENAVPAVATDEGGETEENGNETAGGSDEAGSNPSVQPPESLAEEATATDGLYSAPIIRRSGGTPVIQVKFNDSYTVEMIVDTGASGTVLTQVVARTLGVEVIGETNMSTASAQSVPFQLGRVSTIEVEGAVLDNPVVAIAGPGLETGLLGNDFFKDYDVTVKADVVEFRER